MCSVDGAKVPDPSAVPGDFSNWTPHHLLFGDEWNGERNWSGTLEGVAVFCRALNEENVRHEHQACQRMRALRPTAAHLVVDVELIKLAQVPILNEISPCREALVAGESRAKQVVGGELKSQTVRVAHWALLDGAVRAPASRKPGFPRVANLWGSWHFVPKGMAYASRIDLWLVMNLSCPSCVYIDILFRAGVLTLDIEEPSD